MKRMNLAVLVAAFLLSGVLLLASYLTESVPTGSWGLSFQTEGQPPSGPVSASALAQLDGAYLDDSGERVLYLTFDAGYENGFTARILDTLKEQQVPAAFFLVGDYLERNPDLVRRMVDEGHIVGNHTMSHPDMSRITDQETFSRELLGMEELYQSITGQQMEKFYRPPQGLYSEENLKMAQKLGYRTVFWSLAYADWDNQNQPTRDEAMKKLLGRVHSGAVVLLHSTSETNAHILGDVLAAWKDMGYRFAPLTELFADGI